MNKRGRPRRSEHVVEFHLHLWLIEGRDDELISALNQVPARARATWIKRALQVGGFQTGNSDRVEDTEELTDALDSMTF